MYLVGIDIGKLKHSFCLLEKETGEILVEPVFFENSKDGFNALLSSFKHLPQKDILIGTEDTKPWSYVFVHPSIIANRC